MTAAGVSARFNSIVNEAGRANRADRPMAAKPRRRRRQKAVELSAVRAKPPSSKLYIATTSARRDIADGPQSGTSRRCVSSQPYPRE
jgi:hypothetical protein